VLDTFFLNNLRRTPMSDISKRVIALTAGQLGVEESKINEETDFQTDLGADSLDIVELIMAFEDEFDINVNDDAAGKIKTVKQVIDYIESNVE
jgi:acyl carrier protein